MPPSCLAPDQCVAPWLMAEFHFAIQGGGAALEQQGSKPAMSRIAYAAAMLMMVAGYAAADPVAAERLSEGRRIAET